MKSFNENQKIKSGVFVITGTPDELVDVWGFENERLARDFADWIDETDNGDYGIGIFSYPNLPGVARDEVKRMKSLAKSSKEWANVREMDELPFDDKWNVQVEEDSIKVGLKFDKTVVKI